VHKYYDNLTKEEKSFVDENTQQILDNTTTIGFSLRLLKDDRAEVFVDAFAKWVIESRR
jgi:hypothetical protein